MDPRTRNLLEAPITPTLLRLAIPNVITTVVQASTGLIETYFIGVGEGIDDLAPFQAKDFGRALAGLE